MEKPVAKGAPAPLGEDAVIPGTDIPRAPSFIEVLEREAAEDGLRKGERTRRQIRAATARSLSETRYAALSMEQIALQAGVSRAALYQYVPSKEESVRDVLTDFHRRTITMPAAATSGKDVFDTIARTNRYYIDYFAKNAIFMERVRELRDEIPELIRERQRVNTAWARRVADHVRRHGRRRLAPAALTLRILALECMIDDVLRETYVIHNPAFAKFTGDEDGLARELAAIWFNGLYAAAGR
ncbi:transcriptional regulator, TetR family [Rhizobiales bacterium GAS191]|nr:transcriptional regulator, TetR family [Rhizobiales bacterium GAS191]